jgi:hypothetical protein
MTNSKIMLLHSPKGGGAYVSPNGSAATFERGTTVQFRFINEGTEPFQPAIKVVPGPTIPPLISPEDRGKYYTVASNIVARPGATVGLLAGFSYRGTYWLIELLNKKPHGQRVKITIT